MHWNTLVPKLKPSLKTRKHCDSPLNYVSCYLTGNEHFSAGCYREASICYGDAIFGLFASNGPVSAEIEHPTELQERDDSSSASESGVS